MTFHCLKKSVPDFPFRHHLPTTISNDDVFDCDSDDAVMLCLQPEAGLGCHHAVVMIVR